MSVLGLFLAMHVPQVQNCFIIPLKTPSQLKYYFLDYTISPLALFIYFHSFPFSSSPHCVGLLSAQPYSIASPLCPRVRSAHRKVPTHRLLLVFASHQEIRDGYDERPPVQRIVSEAHGPLPVLLRLDERRAAPGVPLNRCAYPNAQALGLGIMVEMGPSQCFGGGMW